MVSKKLIGTAPTASTAPTSLHMTLAFVSLCLMAFALSSEAQTAPDNTQMNERDRNESTLTPLDQSNTKSDVATAAAIRRALIDDDALSTDAKNIKVIVQQGAVTLRGPVTNATEQAKVEGIAKSAQGVTRVNSEIEMKQ